MSLTGDYNTSADFFFFTKILKYMTIFIFLFNHPFFHETKCNEVCTFYFFLYSVNRVYEERVTEVDQVQPLFTCTL